ncbi:selenium cofactor biosynthesis protein YqeC [Peptoniphilus sp.]|jgi:probable selenium-dependent hydroxylase accessory protein YqeC|uniref:selenium cofactor biosynthesis protein YqeC n=1 Tax=Peptoniphilus sp. TaxID=1971214 RepID=UPI003D8C6CBA
MGTNILDFMNIEKGDVVSITGSGGKTTLMNTLAKKLKKRGRVLITTSTKIKIPGEDEADYIYDSVSEYKKNNEENIIVALGEKILDEDKFSAIDEEDLLKIKDDFDYILIEADGCRNMPLKMWKSHEPVIYNVSNKTISVFSAKTIGRKISRDFIYNYEEFRKLITSDVVDKFVFERLIKEDPGPFKNFSGEKFVFFNQVESLDEERRAKEVIQYLREETEDIKYFYGSLLEDKYEN